MGCRIEENSLSRIDTTLESVMIFDGRAGHAQFPIDIVPGLPDHAIAKRQEINFLTSP
jgi:hypothetical protein